MENEAVNKGRRRLLTGAVGVVGGIGAIYAAVPFLRMWRPSARAEAAGAPVSADISKIEPGQRLQFEYRGKPIWVIRRTPEMLAALENHRDQLKDPESKEADQQPAYIDAPYRSLRPELMVVVPVCTHLGCVPSFVPELEPQPFDQNWNGGLFCPCHNSRFDLAGRVYKSVPAPVNLEVPDYSFPSEGEILIGVRPEGAAA